MVNQLPPPHTYSAGSCTRFFFQCTEKNITTCNYRVTAVRPAGSAEGAAGMAASRRASKRVMSSRATCRGAVPGGPRSYESHSAGKVSLQRRKRRWWHKKMAYDEAGLSEGMDGHTGTRTRAGRSAAARRARNSRGRAPPAAEVASSAEQWCPHLQVAARSRPYDCATAGTSATRCMVSISTSSGSSELGRGKMASTTHALRIEPNTSPFAISATLIKTPRSSGEKSHQARKDAARHREGGGSGSPL